MYFNATFSKDNTFNLSIIFFEISVFNKEIKNVFLKIILFYGYIYDMQAKFDMQT